MNKRIALAAVVLLAGWVGCKPSNMAPVTGTVTLDGKPVDKATVIFQIQPEGRPVSWGVTDAQGKFTLTTEEDEQPGALLGTHIVMVRKLEVQGVTPTADGLSGFVPIGSYQEVWATPKKFGDVARSPLRVEVKAGMEPVKLDLKSDPVETE